VRNGQRGGVGIEIELDRVPQRESGMTPYDIMLSESQERMLLVAEKGRERKSTASSVSGDLKPPKSRRYRRWETARGGSTEKLSPRFLTAS